MVVVDAAVTSMAARWISANGVAAISAKDASRVGCRARCFISWTCLDRHATRVRYASLATDNYRPTRRPYGRTDASSSLRDRGIPVWYLHLSAQHGRRRTDSPVITNFHVLEAVASAALIGTLLTFVAALVLFPPLIATIGASVDAGLAFSPVELGIVGEVESILSSSELVELRAAYAAGTSTEVSIAGRTVLFEPELPSSGFTLSAENGFVIGPEAFSSEAELTKTFLHELYRLQTSQILQGVGTEVTAEMQALVTAEMDAAKEFAERAFQAFF